MMKQKISLEISKNEKTFQLVLDADSPLGDCFDVICQFQSYIIDRMKTEIEAKQAKKED